MSVCGEREREGGEEDLVACPLVGPAVLADCPAGSREWNDKRGSHEEGEEGNDSGLVVWSRGKWKRLNKSKNK